MNESDNARLMKLFEKAAVGDLGEAEVAEKDALEVTLLQEMMEAELKKRLLAQAHDRRAKSESKPPITQW